jgi:DoxX-like family
LPTWAFPPWIKPVLGGAEILAAILFLIRPTMTVRGCSLLVIFALAIVIHLLHGDYAADSLLVYFMAVLALMAEDNKSRPQETL